MLGSSRRARHSPVPPLPANLIPGSGSAPEEQALHRLAVDLSQTMAAVHRRGWCDGTGGNFSCVAQRDPLLLLMAPSGVDKGRVAPAALILVDGAGAVVRGEGKASAETLLHLAIVTATGAGAVLHTHSQAGTLLSRWRDPERSQEPAGAGNPTGAVAHLEFEGLEMLKGLAGINTHQVAVRVPVLSNDQDLARLSGHAAPHLADAPHGLLIAGHGLYAWGRDLEEARRHLEIHEFLLEQHWRQLILEGLTGQRNEGRSGPWS
jgi:methylthioribulose-1-phosphate dehydratase